MNKDIPMVVDAVNGFLIKIHSNNHSTIAKTGTVVLPGEQLLLMNGEAQLHMLGLENIYLEAGQTFKLDGISPLLKSLKQGVDVDALIEKAMANGIDPVALLQSLEETAAGEDTILGSGGSTFVLDPLYGVGHVNAGYDTLGPSFSFTESIRFVSFLF
ncbi:hypothetical protein [Legionella tunisiensis]|uniref:hypothetical protein n=1 Tax=Legionella tunisiensis TaxID=1034944 RepID=UPI000303093E|nr:hypothetical protein [Legionella tunisiensis]